MTPTPDRSPESYNPAAPASRGEVERNVLLVTYVLYGLGFFFILTAIAGVIINHVKMQDCADEVAYSHHRWLMRTFWFAVLWTLVSTVLAAAFVGVIGYIIVWLWCLYRVVRGALVFAERRALPAPAR